MLPSTPTARFSLVGGEFNQYILILVSVGRIFASFTGGFPSVSTVSQKGVTAMASDKVQQITDASFASVISSAQPSLVDFWAPWCGPCKALGPVIEEVAEHFAGKATIAKMNVDDNPVTPGKFGIRAIPTMILFKNGQLIDQITGAAAKAQIIDLVNKAL